MPCAKLPLVTASEFEIAAVSLKTRFKRGLGLQIDHALLNDRRFAGCCGSLNFGRTSSLRAMHAVSLGHGILSPLWLGLEPRRKQQLPLGSLLCYTKSMKKTRA